MEQQTEQMKVWSGEFGASYTERNLFADSREFNEFYVKRYGIGKDQMNQAILKDIPKDARILEVGANVGNQLESLRRIGFKNLYGIELQASVVAKAKKLHPEVNIIQGSAFDLPFKDGFFDLVFTNNVLIHISPNDIEKVINEMYRVSKTYIWGFEYFAEKYTEIPYRDHRDLLWKTDFAKEFLNRHSDLKPVHEQMHPCLDEPGNIDKEYLLRKVH